VQGIFQVGLELPVGAMSSSSQASWADVVDSSPSSSDSDSDRLNCADTIEQTASESTSQECAGQGKHEANNGSKDRFLTMKLQQIGKNNCQPDSTASCSSTDSKDKSARKNRKVRKKNTANRNTKFDDGSDAATSDSLGTDSSSCETGPAPGSEVWTTPEAAAQVEAEADVRTAAMLGPERWAEEKAKIPRNSHGYLTSWSSRFHDMNPDDCRPCLFQARPDGCKAGIVCQFCHLPHERLGKTRPCKKKKELFKKRVEQLEQLISEMPEDHQNDVQKLGEFAENILAHSTVDSGKKVQLAKTLVSFTQHHAHSDSRSTTSSVDGDQANPHCTKLSL